MSFVCFCILTAGIHYIGDMHEGSINRVLLDQLTCGQLRWAKMDDAFDMVS